MTKEEIFEKLNDAFKAYHKHLEIIQEFKANSQKNNDTQEISNFIFEQATLTRAYRDKIFEIIDKNLLVQEENFIKVHDKSNV